MSRWPTQRAPLIYEELDYFTVIDTTTYDYEYEMQELLVMNLFVTYIFELKDKYKQLYGVSVGISDV